MSYLFKQKLQLSDLVNFGQAQKKVLIFEPESYLSALYGHYLEAHNFDIKHCPHIAELKSAITDFSPHLLIFNAESQDNHKAVEGINFKRHFPELVVVTTAYNLGNEPLKRLMNAGVSSHINRKLSRPQDVVEIVKALLH